jgi:copper resistance protein D
MTMLTAAAIALRFFHFASLLVVFGAALFRLSVGRDLGVAAFDTWLWRLLVTAAATALLSGATLLIVVAVRFVGTLSSALSVDGLTTVVTQTEFGQIWVWRLALLAVLVIFIVLARIRKNVARPGVAILAGMALATLSAVGHAATGSGTAAAIHQATDAAHLFAAATWFGGLVALFRLLAAGPDTTILARRVVPRFAIVALIAAVAVVASGVAEAVFLLPSLSALIDSGYGRLLLAKVILVAGMIALGAFGRLVLLPALDGSDEALGLAGLRHSVAAEIGLGAAVIAVVAVLGLRAPSL